MNNVSSTTAQTTPKLVSVTDMVNVNLCKTVIHCVPVTMDTTELDVIINQPGTAMGSLTLILVSAVEKVSV